MLTKYVRIFMHLLKTNYDAVSIGYSAELAPTQVLSWTIHFVPASAAYRMQCKMKNGVFLTTSKMYRVVQIQLLLLAVCQIKPLRLHCLFLILISDAY